MPLVPVDIRDADHPGQSSPPLADHTEFGDLKFPAPECLLMVQVCLAPGRNADALVVMSHPFFENSPQVPIIQWNQEIQALTPNAPYLAFAECIGLRRSEWRFENAQAHCLHGRIERGRVDAVAIVDEKPIRLLSSDDLLSLKGRPEWRRYIICGPQPARLLVINMRTRRPHPAGPRRSADNPK